VGPTGVACGARADLLLGLLGLGDREVAGCDDGGARRFLARDLVDLGVDLVGLIGQIDALHLEEQDVPPICLQRGVESQFEPEAVQREHTILLEEVK
tara:strand:+ start:425 stop:715 length:291 start_codon:yes stop_codon:yes gene_type:complete